MKVEKLTEQRSGQNVIVLRESGNRKWSLASAGMVKNSNKYLYGEHADKLAEYEEIGTPEECRAAVEKQKAVKPINVIKKPNSIYAECQVCGQKILKMQYCTKCGQKLDWSDVE